MLVEDLLTRHGETTTVKNKSIERFYKAWWTARFKGLRVNHVTPAVIEDAQRDLLAQQYAPQTVVHYLKALRHVLNKAVRQWINETSMPGFRPAAVSLKMEDVGWHSLRHTFASRLAMSGKTEGKIATLLRHSTNTLVRRYAHLSPSRLQAAVETVAAYGKVARKKQFLVEPDQKPERARPLPKGNIRKPLKILERAMGFEPTTTCLGSKDSTTELRPPRAQKKESYPGG